MTEKIVRKIAVAVCHHKDGPFLKDDVFMPIHVGSAKSKSINDAWFRDDSGENISHKNDSYCELTALYWLWKNVDAEVYGLMHYRRFLTFNAGDYNSYSYTNLEQPRKSHRWHAERLQHLLSEYDVLTSPYWNVHPVGQPSQIMTNYDFYARDHFQKDLDIVLDIIKQDDIEIYRSCLEHIYRTNCNFANLAIMKADYFHGYCEWLFRILGKAEEIVDISSYDKYQRRIWGFIAERLLGCYLVHLNKTQAVRCGELGVIFLQSKAAVSDDGAVLRNIQMQRIEQKPSHVDEATVVFAIDDNYAAHCGTAMLSLLSNNRHIPRLDVYVVLGSNLTPDNEARLGEIAARFTNASLKFILVDESAFSIFPNNRAHISRTTYYRLALHKILPEHVERVLYLDADIIVEDKIDELFVDLDGYYAAAAADEGGVTQSRRLGLPLNHAYFNAGVTMFNLQEIRKIDADTLYLESYFRNNLAITLQDQDILNIAFAGRTKQIELRWNANARLYRMNDLERVYNDEQAFAAGVSPGIIHYTDVPKPWTPGCRHPLRSIYWHWRNQTPWAQTGSRRLGFVGADIKAQALRAWRIASRKLKQTHFLRVQRSR